MHLAPDYAGGGFYASNVGFIGASEFVFSDFLGNHNVYVSTDVFSNSLSQTNALVIYNYLPRRCDLGAGVFHFKTYLASQLTTLREQHGTPRPLPDPHLGSLLAA